LIIMIIDIANKHLQYFL